MASSAQVVQVVQVMATEPPTLGQEMRDSGLLFAMFGLAFLLLAGLVGAVALLQALTS